MNNLSTEHRLALVKGRAMMRYFHEAGPKPPRLRKRTRPHRNRVAIATAIRDSKGSWSLLASKLECSVLTIQNILRRPENEMLLDAFHDQKVKALEGCVQNIFDIANYSPDIGARLRANAFLLQKLHKDFGVNSKVTIEGGANPIRVQATVLQIPAEVLQLPVESQLKMLEMADKQEEDIGLDDTGN